MDDQKVIDVTCALIIDSERRLLATQRSAIIKEELNIEIEIVKSLAPNIHNYPFITVKLIPFISKCTNGEIELKEHADFKWLTTNELLDLDWADADIPILNNYLNYLNAI
jgi:8-oxo-dGTP diphosphatase